MTAVRSCVAALVTIATSSATLAHADEQTGPAALAFEQEHVRASRFERDAMAVLVAGGAASTAVGIGLLTTDRDDQSLRIAGGITAGFGVVNAALGALGLWQARRAERAFAASREARRTSAGLAAAQLDDLRKAQKDTVLYGLNLGLDVGYVLAGAAAIIASRLGADHDSRWLAGGIATCVQGAFDAAIDLGLTLNASRHHRRILDSLIPSVAVLPTATGVNAQLGLSGRF